MRFTQAASQVQKQIFNRSKKRMQKSWAAKREDREDFNYARTMLAEETADRVLNIKRSFTSALELGANQGECSRSLR